MRVAALYDVHGNLPALEAALEDVDEAGVDLLLSGGDLLLGPQPSECLELL
jgi:predicted phosphodiesterase